MNQATIGIAMAVAAWLFFTIDNPPLLSTDARAAIASIELSPSTPDDWVEIEQRTLEAVRRTYQIQCQLWRKDCEKL
jgi:hypothetical protein